MAYGVASYLAFLGAFLYAVGFVGNVAVPKSIESGPGVSLSAAGIVDTLLLLSFAVPHRVMARPAFKRWWTRFVPPHRADQLARREGLPFLAILSRPFVEAARQTFHQQRRERVYLPWITLRLFLSQVLSDSFGRCSQNGAPL